MFTFEWAPLALASKEFLQTLKERGHAPIGSEAQILAEQEGKKKVSNLTWEISKLKKALEGFKGYEISCLEQDTVGAMNEYLDALKDPTVTIGDLVTKLIAFNFLVGRLADIQKKT